MNKFNKKWKIEYSIILLILLGIALMLVPVSFGNTRQANFISKWNEKYNRMEYMFQVINAHITDDVIKSFDNAKTSEEREQLLIQLVKPYIRINIEKSVPRQYKPKYMNGSKIYNGQLYYFDEFYFVPNNGIIGIKDLPKSSNGDTPIFMMMFDINGILLPNRWGKDIFGINIYETGRINAFGEDADMEELKKDCSESSGTGVYCSYYYKIGGGFEE